MGQKVIKLKEKDLHRIVSRVIKEGNKTPKDPKSSNKKRK